MKLRSDGVEKMKLLNRADEGVTGELSSRRATKSQRYNEVL